MFNIKHTMSEVTDKVAKINIEALKLEISQLKQITHNNVAKI